MSRSYLRGHRPVHSGASNTLRRGHPRHKNGFTLPEAIIALAIWALLITGATQLLLYVTRVTTLAFLRQEVLENARVAVDGLRANLQLAEQIYLVTDAEGILRLLTVMEPDANGQPVAYHFYYDKSARPGEAKYHRLEFGLNDEFASYLSRVQIDASMPGWLTITVITDDSGGLPLTLSATVDVRYKAITVVGQ